MNMEKETRIEKSMFNKISQIKRWIIILIIMAVSFFGLSCTNIMGQTHNQKPKLIDTVNFEMIDSPTQIDYVLPHDSIRMEMIDVVQEFLSTSTRGKANDKLAEYLVNNALEHDIDLCFIMSQAKIETHFGTVGAGRQSSRRSLFGIVKRRYSNYDHAVEDYCKILKKSYLVNGKTEKDLMRKYVTGSGHRYASNPNYERELRSVYKEIVNSTNLKLLQDKYNDEYNVYLSSISNLTITDKQVDKLRTS